VAFLFKIKISVLCRNADVVIANVYFLFGFF